jgi:hypothetical protein
MTYARPAPLQKDIGWWDNGLGISLSAALPEKATFSSFDMPEKAESILNLAMAHSGPLF